MSEVEESAQKVITRDDLEELRSKFQSDLVTLREQISLLQSRAAALEAQLAKIEPVIEARASRTEKLVMELQVEMHKLSKLVSGKEAETSVQYGDIKKMLQTLLERSE